MSLARVRASLDELRQSGEFTGGSLINLPDRSGYGYKRRLLLGVDRYQIIASMTATGTASIAVPKLKLGVRDAAKVEQGRARQANANKTEQVATLERTLHETKHETDQAAVEQVYA